MRPTIAFRPAVVCTASVQIHYRLAGNRGLRSSLAALLDGTVEVEQAFRDNDGKWHRLGAADRVPLSGADDRREGRREALPSVHRGARAHTRPRGARPLPPALRRMAATRAPTARRTRAATQRPRAVRLRTVCGLCDRKRMRRAGEV